MLISSASNYWLADRTIPFSALSSKKRTGAGRLYALLALVVFLFALLPFGRLIAAALTRGGAFTLAPALEELTSRSALNAAWNTLESGVVSGCGAVILGATVALLVMLTDIRLKRTISFLFVLSMLMAPQVVALSFLLMTGPSSPLLNAVGLAPPIGTESPLLGRGGVMLLLAIHHAPFAFVILIAGLRTLPREVMEAAEIAGAPAFVTLRRIVLPHVAPFLLAATLLCFVAAVGNFGIPAILGLPVNYLTLPTLIFRRISSFGPSIIADAAALSILVALIAWTATMAGAAVMRRAPERIEGLEPARASFRLGPWRAPVEAALWFVIVAVLILPTLSLLAASLVPTYGVTLSLSTVTLDKFVEVLWRQPLTLRALRNSAAFATIAAAVLILLAVPLGYALARRGGRLRDAAEALLEIPYALPGIVLAIACILLFLRPLPLIGVSIYATPWIILFAYLARFLPMALKPSLAAMSQLSQESDEAATTLGASLMQRMRRIVVPAILPSAAAGGMMVFLTAFNELTVSALLWSVGTETLGVVLFNLEDAGLASEAAAVALCATAVIALAMLLLESFARRLPEGVLPWKI